MKRDDNDDLLMIAYRLLEMASGEAGEGEFADFGAGEAVQDDGEDERGEDKVWHAVRAEIERRARRQVFLPRDLFPEGSYSLLLVLYDNHRQSRSAAIGSLASAAGLEQGTTQRTIELLASYGLVTASAERGAESARWEITVFGTNAVEELFGAEINRAAVPGRNVALGLESTDDLRKLLSLAASQKGKRGDHAPSKRN